MVSKFKIFVGIDQTGAVMANGRPKPLPCTLIDARAAAEGQVSTAPRRIISGLKLNSLRRDDLKHLIALHAPGAEGDTVLVCVDAALALPESLSVRFGDLLSKARDFSHDGKAYGALTAHAFFQSFLPPDLNRGPGSLPRRRIEEQLKANSVFNLKPFQRNVGCGSYRILKDLAQDPRWFSVWPFERPEHSFVFAEGYPSFLWKKLFQLKSRNLDSLKALYPGQSFVSADDADSFALALGAQHFQTQIFDPGIAQSASEGWILGYSTA